LQNLGFSSFSRFWIEISPEAIIPASAHAVEAGLKKKGGVAAAPADDPG
jgi:hypothetical protein